MGMGMCYPNERGDEKMNSISQNLENVIYSYRSGILDKSIFPAIYVIEPTNICNLNCIMCPNDNIKSKGFMDFNLFRSIINQIKTTAKVILLYNTGEPLLHSKIIDMVKYCKEKTDAKIILSSNATLLNKDISKKLIESKLDEIILCLDGNSPETYEKIRIGADYYAVLENILDFIKLADESNKPKVIIQLIKMNINEHEIGEFKNKWSKLNCEVSISNLDNWAHQLPIIINKSEITSSAAISREPCADLWFKMAINHSGEVTICCYDYNKKIRIGSLKDHTIEELWNNNKIKQFRKLHFENKYLDIDFCRNCNKWSKEIDEFAYFPEFSFFRAGRP